MRNPRDVDHVVSKGILNPSLFPEIQQVAEVGRGSDLAPQVLAFLAERKLHVRNNFAKYLGLDSSDVHPDDITIVAFGGSDGAFRAMIGYMGYCGEMRRTGLWDIFTYVSRVFRMLLRNGDVIHRGGCQLGKYYRGLQGETLTEPPAFWVSHPRDTRFAR